MMGRPAPPVVIGRRRRYGKPQSAAREEQVTVGVAFSELITAVNARDLINGGVVNNTLTI